MDDTLPPIPRDLLLTLETMIPERSPPLDWSLDKIRYEAGRRSVIHLLRHHFERQQENILQETT